MRSTLVLDTSAYSRLRTGHEEVIDHLARADNVAVPTVVLGELEGGFRRGSRYRENRRALDDFLDEPFVSTLLVTPDIAVRYGQLYAELRDAGTPIPTNDLWIAACASICGGYLLTFDAHFERVRGLDVVLLR